MDYQSQLPERDARSDQELIAAMNEGDEAAFAVLYYRYRDWVTNLAWRFTEDEHLALDVLQETFLYFLKKFPGFVLTAHLKTFLYPAVKHLSLEARRKALRTQATAEDQEALAVLSAPGDKTDHGELATFLAELPEEQREVLWLRFVDGLTLAEIADTLQLPLGTVKSRLHYALAQLREDPRTKNFF